MVITIFLRVAVEFATKILQKALSDRVVSHLEEKLGSTVVLSGEHMVHGLVAGFDKDTISIHCYVAASRLPTMPQSRWFLKTVCRLLDQ